MYLYADLLRRAETSNPVRVGLIGAGKFGSMFLSQAPTTPGLKVTAIADLEPDRARAACRTAGWSDARIAEAHFTEDALSLFVAPRRRRGRGSHRPAERRGSACPRSVRGREARRNGERRGGRALPARCSPSRRNGPGVVYTMAYGDQPALTCELVEWARCSGFDVAAAGKGTKYLPSYHASTPDSRLGALRPHPGTGAGGGG